MKRGAGGAAAGGCACCARRARGGGGGGGAGGGGGGVGALAAVALLLVYSAGGALLFLALEGGGTGGTGGAAEAAGAAQLRAAAVERLWLLTEDLNILYRANWTRLAARELAALQRDLLRHDQAHRWTFATSFLYALTLITTIGDGCVPVSGLGRVCGAVYACGGVPVVLVYLSAVGGALAGRLRAAAAPRPAPRPAPHLTPFLAALNAAPPPPPPPASRAPAAVAALLVAAYVFLGALLFRATERWSLLDGAYFSFSTLATIGFGPLRPGRAARSVSPRAEDLAVAACCVYIVVGIAVVAVCFTLLQEELGAALRARGVGAAGEGVWEGAGEEAGDAGDMAPPPLVAAELGALPAQRS